MKLDNTQCGLSLANIESRNNIRIPRVMEADTSNGDADKETNKETNKNQFANIIQWLYNIWKQQDQQLYILCVWWWSLIMTLIIIIGNCYVLFFIQILLFFVVISQIVLQL